MSTTHDTPTADLPPYPGEPPLVFDHIDAEGFAVYHFEPIPPGTYRRADGGTIIVCADDNPATCPVCDVPAPQHEADCPHA